LQCWKRPRAAAAVANSGKTQRDFQSSYSDAARVCRIKG
jgi:hypothetical protein